MKITSVEAIPLAIPFRRPFAFASGTAHAADHVLVRITTDDGLVGHGEAPPRPYTYGETAYSIVAAVHELFAPLLVGADPFARERLRAEMGRTVANNTARGAIDVALWDLIGQACGQPVHVLLGHAADEVAVAHMIGLGTPAAMVADAVEMRDEYGVEAFKVKVGRDLAQDMAVVRALRQELGDAVELYADANRGWDADTAIVAARRLADFHVTMLEEPNPADDVLGRRRIVRASPIPVVGDESTITLGGVARSLLDGDAEAISVKVARTGFTESAKIVGLCEGLGVATVVGNQIDGMLGTVASTALACGLRSLARHPVEVTNFLVMTDDVLTEPPVIAEGRAAARQGPGLGVAIDPDKLAHYRADR
ncbi:mandelate racemase/muconate lactonizing enzyme family protein [Actinomycetospora cinnamomea]|uniref:L-alanine-DL-glutamate epimerase-like enolase superfamily enzyme n=1 Tax=Actinomycetospora cinnamomea TaxID=663609 RepID=A0A2U1F6Y4_9PSEU|nr:enolase C-terminal domain-like protein [Actinomycetospora cinnamomea]PVZ07720.1 L-alanine-DL-glutamate epimerase-like enolase superfamily enzyme [Actinomycetospora cinnamomea]